MPEDRVAPHHLTFQGPQLHGAYAQLLHASIAVAAAKAFADPVAVESGGAIFEPGGTRSSLDRLNLHRHWRDARTHTLHDPARWKIQHIGRYVLDGKLPPRHGLL
ncbi:hypothetical protein ACU635_29790 [[Actinomadura] parvosata]|uniref:hypothetical protein n=1 Tax=[Actinomadura] parvosata TaxID=1955412 RepID=UPI00406C93F3